MPNSLNSNVSCGISDRTMPKCDKQSKYRVLTCACVSAVCVLVCACACACVRGLICCEVFCAGCADVCTYVRVCV